MFATSTCTFSGPVDFQGNTPTLITDVWNFSAESCSIEYAVASSTPASSSVEVVSGFTRGELVNGYFLLAILVVICFSFLFHWVRGYKIKQ